ncbi:phosphatidylinositol-glycan biosynthesis class S protein [Mortierella sp. GBAus27b]|nr:phosphatidylinositol-glycan biosynthesis class S protein [Mortierella sp. GBAus27b]
MPLDKETIASRDRTRRLVLLSVWAVVLLGLPLWWKTTRVYRAELPYEDIEHWNEWTTCQPTFLVNINLHLSNSIAISSEQDSAAALAGIRHNVAERVKGLNAGHNSKAEFALEIHVDQSWSGDAAGRPSSVPGTYDLYISPSSATSASIKSQRQGFIQVQTWNKDRIVDAVSETLETIFGAEERTIRQLVSGTEGVGADRVKDQLKTVKYAPGYQLTFSLFSGDASNGVREWKVQEAINSHLAPFLGSLSSVSKFTVESQVQHYASLTFKPQLDTNANEYYLTPDTLPNFINAAEWSLASTVSSLPSLNFLVYVPNPSESPLVIKNGPGAPKSTSNSFLIPRWGGIAILNRDYHTSDSPGVITVPELEPIIKVFLTQLRDLMGLTDLSAVKASSFPIDFHRTSNEAPTAWELDNLLRRRSAENLVDSLSTLKSLAKLVGETPNMVVLDHIHKDVVDALKDVERSCRKLGEQGGYVEALSASREALIKSETAFFDPTMVSMLYFPDEHKYAIYMPLFVPVSVPLMMALLRELKRWKDAKKAAAKAGKEKAE